MGILTVAVVTKPFFFEGQQRGKIAEQALNDLRQEVDAVICIPNDRLLSNISKETTAKDAFIMCDDVLKQAVEGISYLITTPGKMNVDFADIKTILKDAGSALMGIGIASGEKRAEEAAKMAISSPLLDLSVNGARGVLYSISGDEGITMFEIQEASKIITGSLDPDAKVIFGTIYDDTLKKGDIKVTVIASGFPDDVVNKSFFASHTPKRMSDEDSDEKEDTREKETESILETLKLSKKPEKRDEKEIIINKEPEQKKETLKVPEDEDDDWAVPNFLRRSKIK
jgi:cell division protein FtsZ